MFPKPQWPHAGIVPPHTPQWESRASTPQARWVWEMLHNISFNVLLTLPTCYLRFSCMWVLHLATRGSYNPGIVVFWQLEVGFLEFFLTDMFVLHLHSVHLCTATLWHDKLCFSYLLSLSSWCVSVCVPLTAARNLKMVDIVALKMPSENDVHVARSFLSKILRSSMRYGSVASHVLPLVILPSCLASALRHL